MSSKRIAVVTGGNKGVGLEICRQLADQVVVVLTARDERLGADAVAKLHASGLQDVIFHQLDVTDLASIASLENFIDGQFGKLDILVNNAGISSTIVDEESFWSLDLSFPSEAIHEKAKRSKKVVTQTFEGAQKCLETNYYGAKHVTQALLPLVLKSGSPRIVNVSSKLGQLKNIEDENIKRILSDFDGLTEELVDEVVNEYLKDAKLLGLLEKKGWSSNLSGYIVSKAALNAYTRILANKYPSISANVVTPGLVATDMTFFKGPLTAEEGAKEAVRLALISDGGPSGNDLIHALTGHTLLVSSQQLSRSVDSFEVALLNSLHLVQVTNDTVDLLSDTIEEPYELGEECLGTNYYATKRITDAHVPLLELSRSSRIVNDLINTNEEGAKGQVQVTNDTVDLLSDTIEEPYELGEECLGTNYYATKRITDAHVPLLELSRSSRIVNVQVTNDTVDLLSDTIEEPYELGEECLGTNYYATKRITNAHVPLLELSRSSRIVNDLINTNEEGAKGQEQ
ncbi:glucose/ribitol dehydrogenase [Artemisia annua]|uniref:Glucose/ribitol dehydrogenase n=1 Tax=Artemisia annua TaxID=35608 RepID=A0A2U1N389_ARTAN|nr:glucose/ribitol dehydrogenase [Artemisia annua]